MNDWPLSGRADEMALLAGVLTDDAREAGVVIVGGAGFGKTRLARAAAAAAAQRGWVVRSVQGTAAAHAIPLGAFAQWIDQQDDQPLSGVRAVVAALTESPANAPILVVIDDAQLLDEQSAFVVHQLVRRKSATVILTLRTGEPASSTRRPGYARMPCVAASGYLRSVSDRRGF